MIALENIDREEAVGQDETNNQEEKFERPNFTEGTKDTIPEFEQAVENLRRFMHLPESWKSIESLLQKEEDILKTMQAVIMMIGQTQRSEQNVQRQLRSDKFLNFVIYFDPFKVS